jgi:hypothetical protein
LHRWLLGAVLAALFATVVAPQAQAALSDGVKINPAKPIVDDVVTVSFKVTNRLKSGWHYEFTILGGTGYACASFVHKESKRRPAKGRVLSMTLSSYDDVVNGGDEWCQGKASAMVSIVPDSGPGDGELVRLKTFRFYGKP